MTNQTRKAEVRTPLQLLADLDIAIYQSEKERKPCKKLKWYKHRVKYAYEKCGNSWEKIYSFWERA